MKQYKIRVVIPVEVDAFSIKQAKKIALDSFYGKENPKGCIVGSVFDFTYERMYNEAYLLNRRIKNAH